MVHVVIKLLQMLIIVMGTGQEKEPCIGMTHVEVVVKTMVIGLALAVTGDTHPQGVDVKLNI